MLLDLFRIACFESIRYAVGPRAGVGLLLEVATGQDRDKAILHLLIGKVEPVGIAPGIDGLDGEVATLVNHRQRLFHICLVIDKGFGRIGTADQFVDVLFEMVQEAYQVGRRARGEPEVAHEATGEAIQQAEGIVDV